MSSSMISKQWACESTVPTPEYLTARGDIPTCLKVSTTGTHGFPPFPVQAFCLSGTEPLDQPPAYCSNQRQDNDPWYFWWSPCDKCGTAWRIFTERDNDQSYYKLPSELPTELPQENQEESWLAWNGQDWESTTLILEPCEDPEKECMVSKAEPLDYDDENVGTSNTDDFIPSLPESHTNNHWSHHTPSNSGGWESVPGSEESSSSGGGIDPFAVFGILVVILALLGVACAVGSKKGESSTGGSSSTGKRRGHSSTSRHESGTHGGGFVGASGGGCGGGGGGGGCGGGGGGCGGGC